MLNRLPMPGKPSQLHGGLRAPGSSSVITTLRERFSEQVLCWRRSPVPRFIDATERENELL